MPAAFPTPQLPAPAQDNSLLLELFQLYESMGPLKICFEDLSGVVRDVPMLRLPVPYQMHGCEFCMLAKNQGSQAATDCAVNKFAVNRLAIRRRSGFHGQCHLGLTDIVEPLVFRHRVLGAFYYGAVVVQGTEALAESRIQQYCARRGYDPAALLAGLQAAPRITPRELATYQERVRYAARLTCALLESWGLPEERYRAEVTGTLWGTRRKMRNLPPLVQGAVRHVQLAYAEPISIATIAQALKCHPDYLSRTFRKHMGCTLSGYVQRVRVDHARQMLASNRFSVSEIGYEVGFQEKSHFGRIFRKLVGTSPGEYRESTRAAGAPR